MKTLREMGDMTVECSSRAKKTVSSPRNKSDSNTHTGDVRWWLPKSQPLRPALLRAAGARASGASEPSPPVSRPGLRTRPQRVPLHGPTMGASVPSHFRGSQCLETERQTTCRAVREGEGLIFTNRKASS